MKQKTLEKYLELLVLIEDDKDDFNNSGLIVCPGEEVLEYRMQMDDQGNLDLFCRPKGTLDKLIGYHHYLIQKETNERNELIRKAHNDFRDRLFRTTLHNAEYKLNEKQFNIVFTKAYEEGHAHGYSEVEEVFHDLLDFLNDVLKAV